MQYIFSLFFFLFLLSSFEQKQNESQEHLYHSEGRISYVITQDCKIYADTSLTKELISLSFGTAVDILTEPYEEAPTKIIGSWKHKLLPVRFTKDKDTISGYAFETNLSFFYDYTSDGNMVLAGFDNFETNPLTAKLIVVNKQNLQVAKASFPMIGGDVNWETGIRSYGYYTEGGITNDHKSSGFNNVVSITLYYPACGYLSREHVFNYHNQKLTPIAECDESSDAGFYHSESYLIFPDEPKGKRNCIYKVEHTVEYEITENEEYKVNNDDSLLVRLKWDMNKGVIKADTLYNNFDR